jgi:hypothetical protein
MFQQLSTIECGYVLASVYGNCCEVTHLGAYLYMSTYVNGRPCDFRDQRPGPGLVLCAS